ncbi:MAG: hypothetical protein N2Z59_08205, partial [Alteraurantiacibacter sp.]|nr:hypothetical protein [Alteraurantiacibacter sp.]
MIYKYPRDLSRSALLRFAACVLMLSALMGPAVTTPAYAVGEEQRAAEPQAPTAIGGVVFRDFNANGTQDTNEPGVPGV